MKARRGTVKLFPIGLVLLFLAGVGLLLFSTRLSTRQRLSSGIGSIVETEEGIIGYHTVRPNETIPCIARAYGVDPLALAQQNGVLCPDCVYPGMVLALPAVYSSLPAGPTCARQYPGFPSPPPTPVSMIETEWPATIEISESDSIRISLVQTWPSHVPTVEIVHHTAKAATPIPVGTPSVPLERAFGPEYRAFAIARLDGAAFRCLPSEYNYRSLEQPQLDWTWNCLPTCSGDHSVDVHIYVRWEPTEEGDILEREVWRSRLEIPVTEPWIKRDHLGVLSLVSGLFGSALSVPWLYEQIREAGERRRKREESKPKLYIVRK